MVVRGASTQYNCWQATDEYSSTERATEHRECHALALLLPRATITQSGTARVARTSVI